ncbi:DUF4913 domain-containing protein, partial [Streptomyces sp. NPDC090442]|uniref:DUF4913 domain-containing protein n=1 Tax=Streptomyces sp. NPDC090442 TaxID=3365962 RepID=UPI00382B54CF
GAPASSTGKNKGKGKGGKARGRKGGRKKREEKEPPKLVFATVNEFVTDYLAPTIRRNLEGTELTWCPSWWRHPEALQRLTALWRAWESLRLDAAMGMSVWWLQHCDPHLRALMDPNTGPLSACRPDGHSAYAYSPLPMEAANASLWLSPSLSAAPEAVKSGAPATP